MLFKEFFDLFLERKSWGENLVTGGKIAQLIASKIKSGKMSIIPPDNVIRINYQGTRLKIVLKAFNNHRNNQQIKGANAYFTEDAMGNPVIYIFLFEIFYHEISDKTKTYRGYPIAKLNTILQNFFQRGYSTNILSNLQHELLHAYERIVGTDVHTSKSTQPSPDEGNEQLNYIDYLNRPEEIHARIVQFAFDANKKWSDISKNPETDYFDDDRNGALKETRTAMSKFKHMRILDKENRKKFVKGVYTTLDFIWDYYKTANQASLKVKELTTPEIVKVANKVK